MKKKTTLDTVAVHGDGRREHLGESLSMPIFQTATFWFKNSEELRKYQEHEIIREEYGRYGNPTWKAAERHLAALENGEQAVLFSSGMAAIGISLLTLLENGQHLILTSDCYRRTRQLVRTLLTRQGIRVSFLDPNRPQDLSGLLGETGGVLLTELPSNPFLRVMDLREAVPLAHSRGYKVIVDATFATPINIRPLDWGADLVLQSATKYLAGHNDLLAGVAVGKATIIDPLREAAGVFGAITGAQEAFLLLRGLKTLGLRVRRQNQTGLELARALQDHPRIRRVFYPGLSSHPDHRVASALMDGFGGVVTFELEAGFEDTVRFVDGCEIPFLAPSLGGVETLIEMPLLMSYWDKPEAERASYGISDSLVRFSCGIENPDDILADVLGSLERLGKVPPRALAGRAEQPS